MKRWMTCIGAVSLITGVVVGVAMRDVYAAWDAQAEDPWLEHFRQKYDLRPEQVRAAREIRMSAERNRIEVQLNNSHRLPADVRRKVDRIGREADDRICYAVLDPDQREQYRKDRDGADSDPKTKNK